MVDPKIQDQHQKTDWTVGPEGAANTSVGFHLITEEVERIIRGSGADLIGGRADIVAVLIVARLAHGRWKMQPHGEPPNELDRAMRTIFGAGNK